MKQGYQQRTARKHVGTYKPKIDGRVKANGKAEFLDDLTLGIQYPGLLYSRVLRSPLPHARIRSMNTKKAEESPGVHLVLRYDDPEMLALKPTTNAWTSYNTVSYEKMYWPSYRDRKVLDDMARWVGDEVGAFVVAESEEIAELALSLIEIDWEELDFVLDPKEAMKKEAPVIHPEINPEGNIMLPEDVCGGDVYRERGDIEKGFHEADEIVEVCSDYHFADHGCLDTRGCLMEWKDDELTCLTNLYQADQTRMFISQMLEIPLNKVRVICPYVGGSFGRGNTGDQCYYIYTAIAARRTGRPIKMKYTRYEDFHDTRNGIEWYGKVGAKKDGTITACYFKGIGDSGAYCEHTIAALKFMTGFEIDECMLAHIPNMKMEAYAVYTNKIPSSCKRGIGNNQFNMTLFLAVDLLAEKLSIDPLEMTMKNFGHEWEKLPNESVCGVLREGAKRIGWENRLATNEGPLIDGCRKKGLGFSLHNGWHTAWQEKPRGMVQLGLKLNPDLSVILEATMAETGCGSNSCAVWSCAEHLDFLGIAPDQIKWIEKADTDTGHKDMVQTDSAVSFLHAELMPDMAEKLKKKILAMASTEMEKPVDQLAIKGGMVCSTVDPQIKKSIRDILWNDTLVPIHLVVEKMPPLEITGVPFEATFAEVEVDVETGWVEVTKLVQLSDCGTVMYASGAEAQTIGGQAMGLGEALTEEIVYDPATGIPLNFNWIDYWIPTMLDMPEIEGVPMEVWKGAGEYGACGIGESVTTCTCRAITSAIYNATGALVNSTPFKPEKVLAALDKINSVNDEGEKETEK